MAYSLDRGDDLVVSKNHCLSVVIFLSLLGLRFKLTYVISFDSSYGMRIIK